jgi:hypothetical protein
MKLVIYYYRDKKEYERVMEVVKCVGIIVNNNDINQDYIKNDIDNIYINYKNILYKFNRYDTLFINKVEEAIQKNPYSHCPGINYEGHLHIFNIDDRFTNKKYYTITKNQKNDHIDINTNLIIDDLYYNRLETVP